MNVDKYYQKGRYDIRTESAKAEVSNFYSNRIKAIRRSLVGYSFTKVLDAGCGDGEIGKLLKEQLNIDVYGIDISRKGVALAKQKGLHAKVADMSVRIPYKNNTFDLVISSATIEHVINPDIFLQEVYRVLKPNGIVLVSTPNLSFWLNRIIFMIGLYPLFLEASTEAKVGYGSWKKFFYSTQLVGHIHVFNLPALKELLQYQKFSTDNVYGNTIDFVTPGSKIITWIYRFIDKLMSYFPSFSSDLIVVAKKVKH